MELSSCGNRRGALDSNRPEAQQKNQVIAFGAKEIDWNEKLEKLIVEVNPESGMEAVRNAVERNVLKAFEVFINEASIGYLICRIDTLLNGARRFTVCHTLSDIKGRTPLVMIASVLLKDLARKYACKKVLCFADRLGWEGTLKKAGYKYRDSSFEIEVD